MSRGLGLRQRSIVAALDAAPAAHLNALVGESCTRSERVAFQRAARMLQAKGAISIFDYWDVATQKHLYVLHRPRYDIEAYARTDGLTESVLGWPREAVRA